VVFIHGQAGQGKTTLAASLVHVEHAPWTWLDLDSDDRCPNALCAKLFNAAIQGGMPRAGESGFPFPGPEHRGGDPAGLYLFWAQSFAEWSRPSSIIVLDGFETLMGHPQALHFVKAVLTACLSGHRFVILSRKAPPQWIQDLAIQEEADLLTNEDLAFTLEDVEVFFRSRLHSVLSKELWEWVLAQTAGWPAAMGMLASLWDHLPSGNGEGDFVRCMAHGLKDAACAYFQESLLPDLESGQRDILMRCSLFGEIDDRLVKAVAQSRHHVPLFRQLCRDRVFLSPVLGADHELAFRFHPLFRRYLQSLFEEEVSEKERKRLLCRVGHVRFQRKEHVEALKCFLKAGDPDQALIVLGSLSDERLPIDHDPALISLLDSFPEDLQEREPWLLLHKALAVRFKEADKNISRLMKARTAFAAQGKRKGHLLALAFLIEAVSFRGRDVVPLQELANEAHDFLGSLGLDELPVERALLLLQLGYVSATRLGQPEKGQRLCRQAGWLASQLQSDHLSGLCTLYQGLVLVWCGEFARAEETCRSLRASPLISRRSELQAMLEMGWAGMAAIKGDSQSARDHLSLAQDTVDRSGLTYLAPLTLLYAVFLHLARKEQPQAEKGCQELLGYATERDNPFLQARVHLWLGVTRHHQGAFERAREDYARAMAGFGSSECFSFSHLLLARILNAVNAVHLGEPEQGLEVFEACLQDFQSQPNGLLETCTRLGRILACAALKRRQILQPDLEMVFETLQGWNAHGLVFLRDQDLQQCCFMALELKLFGARDMALRVWERSSTSEAGPLPEGETAGKTTPEKPLVRDLCRDLRKRRAPKIEIKTLGGFEVLKNHQQIPEEAWTGKIPRRLLKAVVSRGGRAVSSIQLQEDIWPDCDSAQGRFKIALHRMRRALEPQYEPALGSTYVHLSQDRVCLDPDLVDIDASGFEDHLREAGICEDRGEVSSALSHYAQALELYQGDFLPEEVLAPWAEGKRNSLKSRYFGALMACARLHKQRGANSRAATLYQRAVEENPLSEEAFRQLIILYTNMKLYNEALQTFEACKANLRSRLGTDPDPLTVSLGKKALSSRQTR
jgi:ATP/maltotriose-dependent transcriptional regulator MalT/DNA-binding SARP family transcriptional activator